MADSVTKEDLKEAYDLGRQKGGELTLESMIEHSDGRWNKPKVVRILNSLVQERLVGTPKKRSQGGIAAAVRPQEVVSAVRKLADDEHKVYCVVEEAGSRGVWSRDIARNASVATMNAVKITKTLKSLEDRKIIKQIKNIHSKARKTYVLAYLEADKEVVGGAFYANGEFDLDLVQRIRSQILLMLRSGNTCNLQELQNYLKSTGVAGDMNKEDLQTVLRTLVLEQVVQVNMAPSNSELVFSVAQWGLTDIEDTLDTSPCFSCPIKSNCIRGLVEPSMLARPNAMVVPPGLISPVSCEYLDMVRSCFNIAHVLPVARVCADQLTNRGASKQKA
ncbi:MAG: hypothetical protein KVP17_003699 [Porospora cf. gigantea B]|uniref:uncharacterized protein n=1 Tax=Porospora cf. gigantea B TaxID=2853592 RepID=UPI0035718129|nr:MAG: hypothetical protein KVP17_003699 [Porospora cf. gigantea B]